MMNNRNDKLKQCLIEAMEADIAKLKEQAESSEPHVFSEEFEAKMQAIIDGVEKKSKHLAMRRIAIATVAALVLVVGGLGISTSNANASKTVVDIVAWIKEYFNFENGSENKEEVAISFDESQMSYIPEGFTKSGEQILFNSVTYKYTNSQRMYFNIKVYASKFSYHQNDENINYEIGVSKSGREYSYVYNKDKEVNVILWENEDGIFYMLNGNIALDELVMIMDNIK